MNVISLWGLPGVGKTFWGKTWAKNHKIEFFDLDDLIEFKTNQSVADIFSNHGEEYFRKIESEVLSEFLKNAFPCILALGGGTPISDINKSILLRESISIFLNAPLEIIQSNLSQGVNKRPLFDKKDSKTVLSDLYKKRLPHYKQASFEIEYPFQLSSLDTIIKNISRPLH